MWHKNAPTQWYMTEKRKISIDLTDFNLVLVFYSNLINTKLNTEFSYLVHRHLVYYDADFFHDD